MMVCTAPGQLLHVEGRATSLDKQPVKQCCVMASVEFPFQPGSDRGRGDGDREPRAPQVAVVRSRRNLARLDQQPDDEAAHQQPRQRLLDRVVNYSFMLLRGVRKAATFLAILLGAAMLIKFMTLADEMLTARHNPVLVHGHELLSTLRAVCDSHACQRYAWELQASLNVYRNPCRSLYEFVCGRWRRGAAVPSVREMAQMRLRREAMQSTLAWNSTQSASPEDVFDRVVGLVSSCLRGRRNPTELTSFLRDHGVFPNQWRSSPHAVLTTLVDLSLNWDIHVWFQLTVDAHENASTRVYIARSIDLEKRADVLRKIGKSKKYKASVEAAFRILGLPEEEIAAAAARKSSTDALVSEILKNSEAVLEMGPLDMRLETVAETFTPAAPVQAWLDALLVAAPTVVNISKNTFVRVQSTRLLGTLNSLLEFASRRQDDVAEYIAYHVFMEIGWMVDDRNATTRDRPLYFMPAKMTKRCLREVDRMTGLAWFSVLTAPHVGANFTRDLLALIAPDVASSTDIIVPSDASVQLDVLPGPQSSFFSEWLAFRKARLELTSSGLYDILRADGIVPSGSWHWERNLTAEPLFFSYPFFHTQLHPALNYGGAGRLIARALLGLVTPNASEAAEELAVSVALRALRSTLGGQEDAITNSAAVDQLFFMASCYAVCDAEDSAETARRACDAPVMKRPAFLTAFGCSSSAGRKSRVAHVKLLDFNH
ncbi:hypothetical protein HPB51_018598 [Rhipicephalus microplus]|uniref:Peptidase M13 N-terminal domain-containing protein n=1 Tax=Rhipicephalus microplus TaxID=6941 RepID=A0A9J6E357_RHIMP|nr:hypothetical protein HPB51_018598 [Rhipicephalus microplus]